MKKMKKAMSVLAATALLVLATGVGSLTAHAAEPVTYSVKYIGGEYNDWRYQVGSTFDDSAYHREQYCLRQDLKDGDLVVVYGADAPSGKELDLGTAKLGNLTIFQNASTIVHTGGVQDCYVLAGSYCSINGNVTHAYLYDNTTCNFNNNVLDMTLYYGGDSPESNVSCAGTVGHFAGISKKNDSKYLELFNISENAFRMTDGATQVPSGKYSPEPTAEYLQAMKDASTPVTTGTTPSGSTGKPSSEYDSVPKTGESNVSIILLCVSALCFTGNLILRKKSR